MKIIDVSWPMSINMTTYKDRKDFSIQQTKEFEKDHVRSSLITLGSHTGTHVDAPAHFLVDGSSIDRISLDRLMGHCTVVEIPMSSARVVVQDLRNYSIKKDSIVLLKTANSMRGDQDPFDYHFIPLDVSAAAYLVSCGIKAVGFDYLGIERDDPLHETHKIFMNHAIPIIEGLRLHEVSPGEYQFICLPLYTIGLEAAPARAILIQPDK